MTRGHLHVSVPWLALVERVRRQREAVTNISTVHRASERACDQRAFPARRSDNQEPGLHFGNSPRHHLWLHALQST